jgi:dihydropyrimidine dehydrogenase (NAD+) subunit PreT
LSAPAAPQRTTVWSIIGWLLISSLTAFLSALALLVTLVGTTYFLADMVAREDHSLHELYRPGGLVGLATGFMGTGLMMVLLVYSVRKWLPFTGFMGAPPWWMRFHMICGVLGPYFIFVHEGFKLPTGLVGMGFWLMNLVAISGIFGRYLFGYIPTTAEGHKSSLRQQATAMKELTARLVGETREARDAEAVQAAVRLARASVSKPRNLGELVFLDVEVRRRVEVVRALLWRAGLPKATRTKAIRTLVSQLQSQRSIAGLEVAQRYSKYWQLFHQPLAFAMYVIIAVHILQALLFGGVIPTLLSVLPGE